jgi:hypothetical protein
LTASTAYTMSKEDVILATIAGVAVLILWLGFSAAQGAMNGKAVVIGIVAAVVVFVTLLFD